MAKGKEKKCSSTGPVTRGHSSVILTSLALPGASAQLFDSILSSKREEKGKLCYRPVQTSEVLGPLRRVILNLLLRLSRAGRRAPVAAAADAAPGGDVNV